PESCGPALARERMCTGRIVDAEEALRIGLANRVAPPAELPSLLAEMASAIAGNSPTAVRASKEVIDLATTIPDAGKRELEHNLKLRQGEDHRERFRAAADRVVRRQGA